jgi:Outer membrane protein beta-barrel domain
MSRMPKNEFEKKVREELEGLRLKPSDEVWKQVSTGIRPEKRRRRWLIWVPFLFLGLAGGGYWLMKGDVPGTNSIVQKDETTTNKSETKGQEAVRDADKNLVDISKRENTSAEKKTRKESESVKPVNEIGENVGDDRGVNRSKRDDARKIDKVNKVGKVNKGSKLNKVDKGDGATKGNNEKEAKPVNVEKNSARDSLVADTAFAVNEPDSKPDKTFLDSAAEVKTKDDIVAQKNPDSLAIARIDPKTKSTGFPKWEYGVTAKAGSSNIRSDFFLINSNTRAADYNTGSGTAYPQTSGYVHDSLYKESAFSWGAGFFVQRNFNHRLSINAGVMYTQYNFLIRVGNRIDSAIYVPFSSAIVSNYYPGGDKEYKNRFHYIEIPIAFSLQLNKGKKIPIRWDAGITPGFLVNSNFLYPDISQHIYYQDNSILRKMQWNVQTGFTVGLFSQDKHSLQIGPQIQYMFTNLVNNAAASNQHLGFIGLRANLKLWNSNPMQRSDSN